ncbi:MAG: 3'(2'),5'-bisphosphate nucleotidase [Fuerstiella sp.]|nr:3'(2'),5'-bisphosphate nucleotidase [Fuerstiella sp.]
MKPSEFPELNTALTAVRQAAGVCRSVQASMDPDALEKKDRSPVTVADFAGQALICRQLQLAYPNDAVIGEEGADELRKPEGVSFLELVHRECVTVCGKCSVGEVCDWIDRGSQQNYCSRFWTLDPIDGTKGFLRNDQYAISLALIIDGEIAIGVLGCPNLPVDSNEPEGARGVLAWGVAGRGSWMVPLDAAESMPVKLNVTGTQQVTASRFCESVESGHSSHDWSGKIASALGITREPFRIDSQCKYFAVARGDADIYLRLPTRKGYQEKIWDHAGGVILVEEAGGCVTDIHGVLPRFNHGRTLSANEGMVVTNGQFHQAVVGAVGACAPA